VTAMKTLYLLRHAKSSWDEPELADQERPLAPRGRRDAKRIAKHLLQSGVQPELVLCSSAVRTRETLELVRPGLGAAAEVTVEDGLYGASSTELVERVRAVPDAVDSVMLIGHNPGIQDLALVLAGSGAELERLRTKFPTAALASLTPGMATWRELSAGEAVLDGFVVPKELR
jgi:phosphohistidine phosphatase